MKTKSAVALALALSLPLAACGGGAEEDASEAAATATETAAPAAASTDAAPSPGATETAVATPSPTESASPSPTPVATATAAARPSPSPAAAAAASPPQAFAQCVACHSTTPGKHGIGPSLAGVYGDKAGAAPGFEFSQAMIDSGLTWNEATLDRFLADPRGVVPGTKMVYGGLKDATRRQEVIDYMKTLR